MITVGILKKIVSATIFSVATLAMGADMSSRYCVILAGGNGERLWPLSRIEKPKQLLSICDQQTLLEQAVDRVKPLVPEGHVWISTTEQHVAKIDALFAHRSLRICVEPGSRNTGPAILLCCMQIYAQDPNAVIIFLPADAFIPNHDYDLFRLYVEQAFAHAEQNQTITLLGVKPTYPATGYGYIEFDRLQMHAPFTVIHFKEKPSYEVAKQYCADGNKLWNIGIFCAQAATFIQEFELYAPAMSNAVAAFFSNQGQYDQVPADSIDYAVLEKSTRVSVVPVDFSWCDVGNLEVFLSLKNYYSATSLATPLEVNASGNLVDVSGKKVALIGVDDLCIIETADVLLITKRRDAEKVKEIVAQLKKDNQTSYL